MHRRGALPTELPRLTLFTARLVGPDLLILCCVAPQIPFTRYNIEDMLRVSDRLRVELVKEACTAYLEREMTSYNVLETLLL